MKSAIVYNGEEMNKYSLLKKIETTNLLKEIFIYFLLSQVFH